VVKYVKYSDIWGGEFVKIVTKKGGKNGSKVKKGHLGRSALGALRQFMSIDVSDKTLEGPNGAGVPLLVHNIQLLTAANNSMRSITRA